MEMNKNVADGKRDSDKGTPVFEYTAGKYYRTYLDEPVCLDYADDNFCSMVGYSREEIHELFDDRYIGMIYPEDRGIYESFIKTMQSEECSLMAQYRLVRKTGDIILVSDTMTSKLSDDGYKQAFSVVTELNETESEKIIKGICTNMISCGSIRFTDEKYPSVFSMNDGMEAMLRAGEDSSGMMGDIRENIYMMIPFEYRRLFRNYLSRIEENDRHVSLKLELFRCDGKRLSVIGCICRHVISGRKEYQGVFFDISACMEDEYSLLKEDFAEAMRHMYDSVFEVSLTDETVRCLYIDDPDDNGDTMTDVRMVLEDAIEYWARKVYPDEDRRRFIDFFEGIRQRRFEGHMTQTIEFGICRTDRISSGGESFIRYYSGTYFRLNDMTGMFGCVDITSRKNGSDSLYRRGNLIEFRKKGNMVQLINISEETRRCIGISRKDTEQVEKESRNITDLFANCFLCGEDIVRIIEHGSIEYTVRINEAHMVRRTARLIVSSADDDGENPYYAILYNIIPAGKPGSVKPAAAKHDAKQRISIRTFGYFDVFINDMPVPFKSAKAKELLAVLVDRRGGYVSAGEAISYLWEEDAANKVTFARYRKVAMRLKNELEEYGISDIVITSGGKRCINQNLVQCDLYDYLSDKEKNRDLFRGTYMLNYSWGEFTQSELQKI